MILQHKDIALIALQMHQFEISALGERLLAITHAMRLKIGLCSDVKSILVAQIIPTGIVGIVTRADGIDVKLLHNLDILNHPRDGNNITAIGIQFVTVGTFY